MNTLVKILITLCLSMLFFSCNIPFDGIKGEGKIVTKEKILETDFDAIKASRGLDVILVNDPNKKIVIEANKNLHDHIKVYVEDKTLHITSDKNIFSADQKTVHVSYTELIKISTTSGASISSREKVVQKTLDIKATSGSDIDLDIISENADISATSGAMIRLSGKVKTQNTRATSGANIYAKELISKTTQVKATSGALIKVYAENNFTGKATSGASISYYGNPETVSEKDNSGGSIRAR